MNTGCRRVQYFCVDTSLNFNRSPPQSTRFIFYTAEYFLYVVYVNAAFYLKTHKQFIVFIFKTITKRKKSKNKYNPLSTEKGQY